MNYCERIENIILQANNYSLNKNNYISKIILSPTYFSELMNSQYITAPSSGYKYNGWPIEPNKHITGIEIIFQ